MATLSVLRFHDASGADRVLAALENMHDREMITLEDAAVVSWPRGHKKPKTHQLVRLKVVAAWSGGTWGSVLGFLVFVPFLGGLMGGATAFLGGAIGAATGAFIGSIFEVGIDENLIEEVRQKVTEGTSALIAMISGATAPEEVIDALRRYDDFEIISTNLPEERENQLLEALAQEQ